MTMTITAPILSVDWPGVLTLRYGAINREAYRLARTNPRVTAKEAAFIARPYIHPDGSVESVESVMLSARDAATQHYGWRNDRVRHDRTAD